MESEIRDGQSVITAITLSALFSELEKAVITSDLCQTFIATHSYFLPTEELINEICNRLLDSKDSSNATLRKVFIARFGNLLKSWAQAQIPLMAADASIQTRLDDGMQRLQSEGDEEIQKYVRTMKQALANSQKKFQEETERIALSPFGNVPTTCERSDEDQTVDLSLVFDTPVDELARSLTFLESLYFNKIPVTELMNKRFEKSEKSPNLFATIERFNIVTSWVATAIVMAPSATRRVDTIVRFIDLAKALEQLNNFSGVIQIVSALQNVSISRLKQIWSLIPPRSMKIFEELCPYANPEGNYAFYRKMLSSANNPFLPYLGCFTKDLTAIEEMTTHLPGSKINWEKMTHLGKILLAVRRAQEFPYKIQPNINLCKRLLSLPLMSEKAIYRVSKQLEPGSSSSGAASAEKITRRTYAREKKKEAKEVKREARKAKAQLREQKAGKSEKEKSPAAGVCTRCAENRASYESVELIRKTIEREKNETRTRQAAIEQRLTDFADFIRQARLGAATASDRFNETKADLLKHFFEITQLEDAVRGNARRMNEVKEQRGRDEDTTAMMLEQVRAYLELTNKLQSSLEILRRAQTTPEGWPPVFDFIRDSIVLMMSSLLSQMQQYFPSVAESVEAISDSSSSSSSASSPASPSSLRRTATLSKLAASAPSPAPPVARRNSSLSHLPALSHSQS